MKQLAAYVGYPDDGNSSVTSATNSLLSSFTTALGQAPTMELAYVDPSLPESEWVAQNQWIVQSWQSDPTFANNVIPVLGLPMAQAGDSADADFKLIASGTWDATYNAIFSAWAQAGYTTLYIRPGWEMNGGWYNWSVTPANAADFVAAFQHIATLAHDFTGATIKVVWNPNVGAGSTAAMTSYYPGNSYVDIIGLDSYGAPVNTDTSPQASSSGANDVELKSIVAFAQAQGKPFALPEVGAGSTDTAFPANLASALVSLDEPVSFVGLWDTNDGDNLQWSGNAAAASAWKSALSEIAGITGDSTGSSGSSSSSGSSGTGTDTIALRISEDAWKGDAKFTVSVDGQQVGGTLTASALHSSGDSGVFLLTGNWGSGAQTVTVDFINDAYGGSSSTDRNLYVNSIAYNGTTEAGTTASLYSDGAVSFTVGGATASASAPADTLTLNLSEDAWEGNAEFVLSIDGKQITTAQPVTTLHSSGNWEQFTFTGNFGAGSHTVGIAFVNDAYGGSPSTDRNLYVDGVTCNGTHYGSGVTTMLSNGTIDFTIATSH